MGQYRTPTDHAKVLDVLLDETGCPLGIETPLPFRLTPSSLPSAASQASARRCATVIRPRGAGLACREGGPRGQRRRLQRFRPLADRPPGLLEASSYAGNGA